VPEAMRWIEQGAAGTGADRPGMQEILADAITTSAPEVSDGERYCWPARVTFRGPRSGHVHPWISQTDSRSSSA